MEETVKRKKRFSTFQIIVLGFAAVILVGALLLMLPFSAKSGSVTPFNEALFTATSAVCVTGLVVHGTASYWSVFGQAILLILIQIGGMGVITVATSFSLISGRKISLKQRSTISEAISAHSIGGTVRLTGFVIKSIFIIELCGALLMLPSFIKAFGARGVWMAVFHSVSAFCNAGFDILGTESAPFSSLTSFSENIVVNTVIMLLIIIGGIGFLTWDDIKHHGFRFKKYRMQSKVILVTSAVLTVLPAAYFFIWEFGGTPKKTRVLYSLFQAVTPRTAGFNTVDLNSLSGAGRGIIIFLMLIGGSPGSTAGGMKTTTVAVLFANMVSVFKRKETPTFFGRSIETQAVKNAATVLTLYLFLFLSGGFVISIAEGLPMGVSLFESASAVGTVGLTLGITPTLGLLSQIILILLMFLGRVGGLTLIYAALSAKQNTMSKFPQEKITVG